MLITSWWSAATKYHSLAELQKKDKKLYSTESLYLQAPAQAMHLQWNSCKYRSVPLTETFLASQVTWYVPCTMNWNPSLCLGKHVGEPQWMRLLGFFTNLHCLQALMWQTWHAAIGFFFLLTVFWTSAVVCLSSKVCQIWKYNPGSCALFSAGDCSDSSHQHFIPNILWSHLSACPSECEDTTRYICCTDQCVVSCLCAVQYCLWRWKG